MSTPSPLWTPRELARVVGGRWAHRPRSGWDPKTVAYNLLVNRAPGCIIVCMSPRTWSRTRPDTSKKLHVWANNGAVAGVVDAAQYDRLPKLPRRFPVLIVEDTRRALTAMARASRERFEGQVIALTATVGKTTTREMLRHVLSAHGEVVANSSNNNNIPGGERTIAATRKDAAYSVVEIGLGPPRHGISTTSRTVRPHLAIVGVIGRGHLDMFGRSELRSTSPLELVARAKCDIFEGLEPDGKAVVYRDQPVYELIVERAQKAGAHLTSYGTHESATVRLCERTVDSEGSTAVCEVDGRRIEFRLTVLGPHMVDNALGVLATAHALGHDVAEAAERLADFSPLRGRSTRAQVAIEGGEVTLIDDSYNATPESVRATIEVLGLVAGPERRKVAVLGDILHLGAESASLHEGLATTIRESGVDVVLTIGDEMAHLREVLGSDVEGRHAADLAALYADLRDVLAPDDVVTVKASTPVGLARVAAALRRGHESL